jgi:hypothetical protein
MALDAPVAYCIEKWRGENIPLCPPIARAEIRRVWGELGREVSEDVLRFYAQVGGIADDHYDEELFWALWPLPRVFHSRTVDEPMKRIPPFGGGLLRSLASQAAISFSHRESSREAAHPLVFGG